jgi:DMSO/TMAO reductase YedYZ molybdopterin-dependent catalytic subunit
MVSSDDDEIELGNAPSRRRFVIGLSTFFVTALAAGIGVGAFKVKSTEYWQNLGDVVSGSDKLQGEVTPVGTFYNVSKNAFDPSVSVQGWTLEVNGMVNKTLSYDYNTIRQLPVINQAHTLTCISNPVGGQLIGNAEWKGTQLKTLLEIAGVKSGVKKLVFTCADGYTDSITINTALDPQTVLVWEMNGAPLEPSHGFPVRALIPNIYGMKNAKWIKEITLVDTEYEGFWQKQGWDNPAIIHTESTLTSLNNGAEVRSGERLTLQGFAFAGQRGIKKVEISTDGGQNWLEAQVKDGLGQNSWQLWHLDWTPTGPGKTVKLVVRATDKTGTLQTASKAEPFPEGSSGWHTLSVRVI